MLRDYDLRTITADELERLVQRTFPGRTFYAAADLGLNRRAPPVVTAVHGGCDPFLDRNFDEWLGGAPVYLSVYQILNRLCRAGAIPPDEYVVTYRTDAP